MKGLLWISLVIAAIVAIYELTWLGRSDLAWVIIGLAVAMGLQAVYLLSKKQEGKKIGTREQNKKIWYEILNKSEGFPKDMAEKFFITDNIDPLKFKENHDYYIMDRYGDHKPTPSCFHPLDAPMAYPYWFASAYPDVVKYFSTIKREEEFTRFFEDMGFTKEDLRHFDNPKMIDQEGYFRVEILYKMKEHYKESHPNAKLECQQ